MNSLRLDKNSVDLNEDARKKIERFAPPPEGISFYLLNGEKLIAQRTEREFVLGRASDANSGPLVDLTDFDGSGQGVSRRHAMVRALDKKYILVDLNSSNGTWLNGQRLVPTKPYDVHNGAVIQLGRMKLLVSYTRPKA